MQKKNLIYLITSGETTSENYHKQSNKILNLIKKAVESEIPLIQIREKNLSAKLLFELTQKAVELTVNSETKLLVNERADIAFASKAHGVHLTSNSVPIETVRANFPENFIVGVSCHCFEKCVEAQKKGADFAVLSPIFETPNKGKPLGLSVLQEVCEKLKPFPIIALGGIDETNYREVLQIADGFAAIRFLNEILNQNHREILSSRTHIRSS